MASEKITRGELGMFTSTPGRPKGSRNKLQHTFVNALEKDFHEFGEGVIRIVRIERPHEYLRIIAMVIPKEFVITDGEMDNMSDEDLMEALKAVREERRMRASQYDA
jgi:hypothetical protein